MVVDRQRKRGLEVIHLKLPCLQLEIERKKLDHPKVWAEGIGGCV
jgi:hypothetical protein